MAESANLHRALELLESGEAKSATEAARIAGVHRSTIQRAMNRRALDSGEAVQVFSIPEGFQHPATADLVRRMLSYDQVTGIFKWLVATNQNMKVGKVAGVTTKAGYIRISIFKKGYLAHRLAWLYVHGVWPDGEIDHRDWDRKNNAISNLRIASSLEQANYRRTTRRDKVRGVSRCGRWRVARIRKGGEQRLIGKFETSDEAAHAYNKAALELFGEFAVINPIGVDK